MAKGRRNRESAGPATLGSTLAAHLCLIVWCKACRHQVEPDVAGQVARYGADLSLTEWAARLARREFWFTGAFSFAVSPAIRPVWSVHRYKAKCTHTSKTAARMEAAVEFAEVRAGGMPDTSIAEKADPIPAAPIISKIALAVVVRPSTPDSTGRKVEPIRRQNAITAKTQIISRL